MNITKEIESLSLVVQWDAVEDFIDTTYTLVLSNGNNSLVTTLTEQTSYTITGLTLNTVYTITISAANMCGHGPEFTTSILLAADNTSTISSISPTVTANTNPVTIASTINSTAIISITTAITDPSGVTTNIVMSPTNNSATDGTTTSDTTSEFLNTSISNILYDVYLKYICDQHCKSQPCGHVKLLVFYKH